MPGYRRLWYVLLLVPFVALLWVSSYATKTPELFGFPFFYWYQFLWVPLAALITLVVYLAARPRRGGDGASRTTGGREPVRTAGDGGAPR